MKQHTSKARFRLLAILLVLCLVMGLGGTGAAFAATADPKPEDLGSNSETISMGSSLFTGSKYFTVSSHKSGLSLRINEEIGDNEYASTTFSNELFINNTFFTIVINDTNYDALSFVFLYDPEIDTSRVTTPAEVTRTVRLEKKDGKVAGSVQNGSDKDFSAATVTGIDFSVGQELKVRVDSAYNVTVNDEKIGTFDADSFPDDRAKLEFRASGIGEIEHETKNQVASFYLTTMGYDSNVLLGDATEYEKISQTFVSETKVKDTSRPIARIDASIMPTYVSETGAGGDTPYYAPLKGTVTVPVSAMDIVKSSFTTKMRVKHSATLLSDWSAVEDDDEEHSVLRKTNTFEPDDAGYYAVTEITLSDGKNSITLTEDDEVDGIKLPIVYHAFADDAKSNEEFRPTLSTGYLDKLQNQPQLDGGSKTKLRLPYPTVPVVSGGTVDAQNPELKELVGIENGIRYYASNARALTYTVHYKAPGSETDSTSSGMTFTASSTGLYIFYLDVEDLKGQHCTAVNELGTAVELSSLTFALQFRDKDELSITVSGFPYEKYVNQSLTLPSGSVSESMGSTSAKVTVYFIETAQGEEVYNCEWTYETKADGTFKKDDDGNKILKLDNNKNRIPMRYDASNADETHPLGEIIYTDYDGNRLEYTKENGAWVCKDRVLDKASEEVTFTPKYKGEYKAVYTAEDTDQNKASEIVRYFTVTDAPKTVTASGNTGSGFRLNVLSIVFLSIAGACAVAIVVILCIKPKDKGEDSGEARGNK